MNLNFPAGFRSPKGAQSSHALVIPFPAILQNPQPLLAWREDHLRSRDALRKSQQGASRAAGKPLPAATENRCGTEGVLRPGLSFA